MLGQLSNTISMQVLHYLEQSIDICDTPLAEIMRLVV